MSDTGGLFEGDEVVVTRCREFPDEHCIEGTVLNADGDDIIVMPFDTTKYGERIRVACMEDLEHE